MDTVLSLGDLGGGFASRGPYRHFAANLDGRPRAQKAGPGGNSRQVFWTRPTAP